MINVRLIQQIFCCLFYISSSKEINIIDEHCLVLRLFTKNLDVKCASKTGT